MAVSKKHNEYKQLLQTQQGAALSDVGHIHLSLLKKLSVIRKKAQTQDTALQIDKLIKKIKKGTAPIKLTAFFKEPKINKKINQALSHTKEKYDFHCEELRVGFADILEKYQGYVGEGNNPGNTGFFGKLYYWWHGHSYSGNYQNAHTENFIKLINRLGLMNKDYIHRLSKLDLFAAPFDYHQQRIFINALYDIFDAAENDYFAELVARDNHYKNKLERQYSANKAKVNVTLHYKKIVHRPKEDDYDKEQEKLEQERKLLGNDKLFYDLQQIRTETLAQKKLINQQLKELKKDIHHVAQQQGLLSRVVKRQGPLCEYQSIYEVAKESDPRCKDVISEDQQERRRIKAQNKRIAWWSALLVGLGEGLVAVAGMMVFPAIPFLVSFIVVGLSGWYCNFFLFRDDTDSTLNKLRLHRKVNGDPVRQLFLDEENNEISTPKKWLIGLFGTLSLATGFVYGALSFFSVQSNLLTLIPSMGMGFAGVCAALPAIATCIGFTCIFFTVISDFIKNERWKGIRDYVKNTYFNVPWSAMSISERLGHVFIRSPFELLKLSLGLAINIAVTVASFGVFYQDSLNLLKKIVGDAPVLAPISQGIAVTNAVTSTPFGIEKVNSLLEPISLRSVLSVCIKALSIIYPLAAIAGTFVDAPKKWANKIAKAIDSFVASICRGNTFADLTLPESKVARSALQQDADSTSSANRTMAGASAVFNGAGQAGVLGNSLATQISVFGVSAIPNKLAADASIDKNNVECTIEHEYKSEKLSKTKNPDNAFTLRLFKNDTIKSIKECDMPRTRTAHRT